MSWGIVAVVGASVVGAGIGAYSSSKASKAQSQAALQAGDIQAMATVEASQIAADAQKYSANLAFNAAAESTHELRRQFNEVSEELRPYREAGTQGLDKFIEMVEKGPGVFEASPGYQFRLSQGLEAIEQSASARGSLNSPQTQKALVEYGQNYATADYDNFLNRYYQSLVPQQTLAQMGQNAAARTGAAGMDMASGIAGISQATAANVGNQALTSAGLQGQYLTSGANAQANALQNAANARASGYINSANAVTGATNQISTLAMLYGMGAFGGGYSPSAWSSNAPMGLAGRGF